MRVVDRVHGDAAHRRAHAAPAHTASLADRLEVVLRVADFADRRAAIDMHLADLARAQAKLNIRAFTCQHLDVRAGGASELRAFAGLHLDAMHFRADGDISQRQRIARLDRRFRAGHELRAGLHALRREYVAALAIGVEQKREMRAAVRIVFEVLDLGRNAVLVAAEIDQAKMVLVPAALVTYGDSAVIVAPAAATLRLGESPVWVALVQ